MFRRSTRRLVSPRVEALRQIDGWPVEFAAAGVVDPTGAVSTRGDAGRAVRLASVSKPVTALAVLIAAEEGVVDLDEPAGPPGSTVRHLLSHTSGLPFEGTEPIARPEHRRIYSNEAFRVLAAHLEDRADMAFADYVREAVCSPLAIGLDPSGDPGSGMHASLDDVLAIGRELLVPRLLADETRDEMVSVQFPGLSGVLPDLGRFDPLDWGLGVQLNTRAAVVDGRAHVRAHVRPLRRHRHVPLGRSGRPRRVRRAHDAGVRRVGEGRVAAPRGRGAGRVGRARRELASASSRRAKPLKAAAVAAAPQRPTIRA